MTGASDPIILFLPRDYRPSRTIAATFSPIMMVGKLVLAHGTLGMIEASATRRPATPSTGAAPPPRGGPSLWAPGPAQRGPPALPAGLIPPQHRGCASPRAPQPRLER